MIGGFGTAEVVEHYLNDIGPRWRELDLSVDERVDRPLDCSSALEQLRESFEEILFGSHGPAARSEPRERTTGWQ